MQNSTNPVKTLGKTSIDQRPAGAALGVRVLTRLFDQIFRGVVDGALSWTRAALANLRRGGGSRRRRLRVVESLALGGRRQLLLVMCDEQEYLLGTGADSVETIILRQPDYRAAEALEPSTASTSAAKNKSGVSIRGGAMHHGNASDRVRDDAMSRPWLVNPANSEVRKHRIREADDGKGQKLWR